MIVHFSLFDSRAGQGDLLIESSAGHSQGVPTGNELYLSVGLRHVSALGNLIVAQRLYETTTNQTGAMNRLAIIREVLDFLRARKRWWIAPIVVFLLMLGGLLIFAKGSALAPFIYSLF